MATYKQIFGKQIKFLSSDPANEAEGQIWYNSTSGTFKSVVLAEATSSADAITTGRYAIGSAGTLTAGLATGGDLFPASPRASNATEEFNGTSWTNGNPIGTARAWLASCGTQTAAIGSGGNLQTPSGITTATEEYDGTTWTGGTAIPNSTEAGNQFGIQTASIFIFGGVPPATPNYPNVAYTQTGGAWTAIPSLNNAQWYGAVTNGTTTAGIAVGGGHPVLAHVEEWNGSAWTNSTAFPETTYNNAGNSCGTSTAMAVAGGTPGTQITIWDGSTWAISPASLATSRAGRPASAGTSTAFYVAGGPPALTACEEFSASPAVQTITTS